MSRGHYSVFLATPCYGGLASIAYISSLLGLQRLCNERQISLQVELGGGDALISRARGIAAAKFLEHTEHSHLLFIDADTGFSADQVLRMLDADKDVIGAVCPIKRYDWAKIGNAARSGADDIAAAGLSYAVRFLPNATNSVEYDDKGFAPVAYVGTGMMLIGRQALRQLTDAHPELRARHVDMAGAAVSEGTMLFETMIDSETGQYLSEDYAFCKRWRDLGGTIYADLTSRLTHVGHAAYVGSLITLDTA